MRSFNKFLVAFYTIIFMAIGIALVFIALHLKQIIDLSLLFEYVLGMSNLWLVLGVSGIVLIVVSFSLANLAYGNFQREKTIAFSNPEGPVTISLSAVEDFIKRITLQIDGVKEIRSNVTATRKGIDIVCKIILWSDANIPEITEKIQLMVKNRVQEMLGIEEAIMVKVHVIKIAHKEEAKQTIKQQEFPYLR